MLVELHCNCLSLALRYRNQTVIMNHFTGLWKRSCFTLSDVHRRTLRRKIIAFVCFSKIILSKTFAL